MKPRLRSPSGLPKITGKVRHSEHMPYALRPVPEGGGCGVIHAKLLLTRLLIYEKTFSRRRLCVDLQVLLCFSGPSDAQSRGHEHLGGVRLRQVPARHSEARTARPAGRGVRPQGRQFPPRGFSGVQGQPRRDSRRHPAFGSLCETGAGGDVHSDSGGRRLRGRRRDRHPVAKGRRSRLRGLHGDARQGLRPASARQL